MLKHKLYAVSFIVLFSLIFFCCTGEKGTTDLVASSDYTDLISLFNEFREFDKTEVIKGVPDYTATAMDKKYRELKTFQTRLARANRLPPGPGGDERARIPTQGSPPLVTRSQLLWRSNTQAPSEPGISSSGRGHFLASHEISGYP